MSGDLAALVPRLTAAAKPELCPTSTRDDSHIGVLEDFRNSTDPSVGAVVDDGDRKVPVCLLREGREADR